MTLVAGLDILEKLSTILAVCVGAAWAYYHYFRGRTFKARLQVELTGVVVRVAGRQYVVASIKLSNLGLTVTKIDQAGTALVVYAPGTNDHRADIYNQDWNETEAAAFTILGAHTQIEPGLTIREDVVIAVPVRQTNLFMLECIVEARKMRWSTRTVTVAQSNTQAA